MNGSCNVNTNVKRCKMVYLISPPPPLYPPYHPTFQNQKHVWMVPLSPTVTLISQFLIPLLLIPLLPPHPQIRHMYGPPFTQLSYPHPSIPHPSTAPTSPNQISGCACPPFTHSHHHSSPPHPFTLNSNSSPQPPLKKKSRKAYQIFLFISVKPLYSINDYT